MSANYAVFMRNASLAAYVAQLGGNAIAEFWNGAKPANQGTPAGSKLATTTFGSAAITDANGGAAGGINAGVLTFGGFTQNSANHVNGTPTFVRLRKSDLTAAVDIDIGTGSGNIQFSGTIATGTNLTGSLTWTAGNA